MLINANTSPRQAGNIVAGSPVLDFHKLCDINSARSQLKKYRSMLDATSHLVVVVFAHV